MVGRVDVVNCPGLVWPIWKIVEVSPLLDAKTAGKVTIMLWNHSVDKICGPVRRDVGRDGSPDRSPAPPGRSPGDNLHTPDDAPRSPESPRSPNGTTSPSLPVLAGGTATAEKSPGRQQADGETEQNRETEPGRRSASKRS